MKRRFCDNRKTLFSRGLSLFVLSQIALLVVPPAFAQGSTVNYSTQTYGPGMQSTTMQSSTLNSSPLPAGTALTVQSDVNNPAPAVGGQYTGVIIQPVTANGNLVLPAGSRVQGTIVSMNPTNRTMDVQFQQIMTPDGRTIPINSQMTVNQPVLAAQVTNTDTHGGVLSYIPTVGFGNRPNMSPGGRIMTATVAGGVFGAATGALAGMTETAVYRNDMDFNEGTGAVRGAAWGGLYGAGLGLVGGLIAAAASRHECNVTSAAVHGCCDNPTNIVPERVTPCADSCGAVAVPVTTTTAPVYNVPAPCNTTP